MKSLLASVIVALLIVITIIAAGEHHGMNISVTKAIVSTYWITLPMIIVGICVDIFGNKRS